MKKEYMDPLLEVWRQSFVDIVTASASDTTPDYDVEAGDGVVDGDDGIF